MRNSLEILNEIDSVLEKEGLNIERQELKDEIRASSTGGELCARSGSLLLKFQKENKKVKESIGSLITEFIFFCNANGIYHKEQSKDFGL